MARTPTQPKTRASGAIPSSIPMPDSPIRQTALYQMFARLARPTLDWIGIGGAAHAFGLLDGLLPTMDDARAIIVLAFVAALYSIRTVEKVRGVA